MASPDNTKTKTNATSDDFIFPMEGELALRGFDARWLRPIVEVMVARGAKAEQFDLAQCRLRNHLHLKISHRRAEACGWSLAVCPNEGYSAGKEYEVSVIGSRYDEILLDYFAVPAYDSCLDSKFVIACRADSMIDRCLRPGGIDPLCVRAILTGELYDNAEA